MKKLIQYILFNLLLAGTLFAAFRLLTPAPYREILDQNMNILIIGFYFFLYSAMHYVLTRINTLKPQTFITAYTGLTGLKLLVLLGFAGIYIFLNQEIAKPFLIVFSICYFFFAAGELVWVYKLMKIKGK
jgi:hypothetical protein